MAKFWIEKKQGYDAISLFLSRQKAYFCLWPSFARHTGICSNIQHLKNWATYFREICCFRRLPVCIMTLFTLSTCMHSMSNCRERDVSLLVLHCICIVLTTQCSHVDHLDLCFNFGLGDFDFKTRRAYSGSFVIRCTGWLCLALCR